MATCKHCGRPLIVSEGRCVYCNHPVQEEGIKSSWVDKAKTTMSSKVKAEPRNVLRSQLIAIVIVLVLGVLVFVYKPWPGCLVSLYMLIVAITLGVLSFIFLHEEGDIKDKEKEAWMAQLNHFRNLTLLCAGFFFIVGIVCLFLGLKWWAVLITEMIGGFVLTPIWAWAADILD